MDADEFDLKIMWWCVCFGMFALVVALVLALMQSFVEAKTAREAINNGYVQQYVEGRSKPIWVKTDTH